MVQEHSHPHHYSPTEYLALERHAEFRNEYLNGEIFAMTGGSRAHNLITVNLAASIGQQLKGRPCESYINDMRVKVDASGLYTYPDLVVVCGDVDIEDEHNDTVLNPTLIIEVLSDSTEAYDRGEKFRHYRSLPSLKEYLLIAQKNIAVELYTRCSDGWLLQEYNQPDDTVTLGSIDCTLLVSDIYDKVGW